MPPSLRDRSRLRRALLAVALLYVPGSAAAEPSRIPAQAQPETVEETLCRLIERSAGTHALPVDFFTRLIWRESSFRSDAVSPKGAQGIAQFMPGTAADRGLIDPFDPETALPASAALLDELRQRFGNLGLAAAAYNAGPARVEKWLAGSGDLPLETRAYLEFVTGREAEDWAADRAAAKSAPPAVAPPAALAPEGAPAGAASTGTPAPEVANAEPAKPDPPKTDAKPLPPIPSCLTVTATLRRGGGAVAQEIATVTAPWGIQLAGNFSKARALASYQRAFRRYASLLDGTQPMIIGSRLRSRGSRAFYRVRVAQPTRQAANALCNRLRAVGGACIVLPS